MDDFDWDAWDAQTAEYLNSSPTYQDYDWAPEYQDWLSSYWQPDLGVFMDPSAWEGYNTESTGQESTYTSSPEVSETSLEQWLGDGLSSSGAGLSLSNLGAAYGMSPNYGSGDDIGQGLKLYGEAPNAYDYAFGNDKGALQQYFSDFNKYLESQPGINEEGLDERAIYRAADKFFEDKFKADDIRAPKLSPEYQARFKVDEQGNSRGINVSLNYQNMLKDLLAKQAIDQMKAKQAYANSGVGKALSGLGMAGMLYQALKGKNNAPKVEARGNQGVSFSPAYQGSSAPKTKYASGGAVLGGLPRMALEQVLRKAGRVQGQGGGQDDVVDIKAAPGEYVFDAEAVSALGDGNTEEGARKLDEMRMNIRKHKRTGGLSAIPPKAKKPEQYMKKGK